MRILLVTHFYAAHGGGIELVAGRLADGLVRKGHHVAWAATDLEGEVPESRDRLEVIPIPGSNAIERITGLPLPIWRRRGLRTLEQEVAAADAVHCHDGLYAGSRAAIAAARRSRRPVVVTQHIGDIPFPSWPLRAALRIANFVWTRPALRRGDRVVFVSDVVSDFFADSVRPERSVTIYNGLEGSLFRPAARSRDSIRASLGLDLERPMFLFVGRFVTRKGLARIRKAAAALPQVQWVLIGRGPIDPKSWRLANVRVEGPVAQESLPAWYGAADLLTLPSVGEGFPLVVQEAMSCGLPCLVSEETRGGCRTVAPLLLSAGPFANDFLPACRQALQRRVELETMRARVAAAAASAWSWDRCVDAYHNLFIGLAPAGEIP